MEALLLKSPPDVSLSEEDKKHLEDMAKGKANAFKGGPGSGNFGHGGRPGQEGGSTAGASLPDEVAKLAEQENLTPRCKRIVANSLVEAEGDYQKAANIAQAANEKIPYDDPAKADYIVATKFLGRLAVAAGIGLLALGQGVLENLIANQITNLITNKSIEDEALKGGTGSGNFSHAGRPGHVGGSSGYPTGVLSSARMPSKQDREAFDRAFSRAYRKQGEKAPQTIIEDQEAKDTSRGAQEMEKIAEENSKEAEKLKTKEAHETAAESHTLAAAAYKDAITQANESSWSHELKVSRIDKMKERMGKHSIMAIYHREEARSTKKSLRNAIKERLERYENR